MYLFQVSALHEDPEKTGVFDALPTRRLGRRVGKENEPFVVPQSIQVRYYV